MVWLSSGISTGGSTIWNSCKLFVKIAICVKIIMLMKSRSVSIFDLKVHGLNPQQEIADLDIQKLWYDTREEIEGMDFSECRDGFEFATYPHLIEGMDAGYYAYLWYVIYKHRFCKHSSTRRWKLRYDSLDLLTREVVRLSPRICSNVYSPRTLEIEAYGTSIAMRSWSVVGARMTCYRYWRGFWDVRQTWMLWSKAFKRQIPRRFDSMLASRVSVLVTRAVFW